MFLIVLFAAQVNTNGAEEKAVVVDGGQMEREGVHVLNLFERVTAAGHELVASHR